MESYLLSNSNSEILSRLFAREVLHMTQIQPQWTIEETICIEDHRQLFPLQIREQMEIPSALRYQEEDHDESNGLSQTEFDKYCKKMCRRKWNFCSKCAKSYDSEELLFVHYRESGHGN
eukprot:TRINITY_DN8166_c0_g1_i1.p1 TRINITY_DN8166_c0_g1~~TRINITY_DN8166_c0_g1_i1.p1  ORF type:complete len:119 (+),score=17.29 TRINITY_DN8166_c0_g1_i1:29-385(+)